MSVSVVVIKHTAVVQYRNASHALVGWLVDGFANVPHRFCVPGLPLNVLFGRSMPLVACFDHTLTNYRVRYRRYVRFFQLAVQEERERERERDKTFVQSNLVQVPGVSFRFLFVFVQTNGYAVCLFSCCNCNTRRLVTSSLTTRAQTSFVSDFNHCFVFFRFLFFFLLVLFVSPTLTLIYFTLLYFHSSHCPPSVLRLHLSALVPPRHARTLVAAAFYDL